MKTPRSYTIEREIDEYVASTRGDQSASQRVNELLRRAIMFEQDEKLEREASVFFSDARNAGRKEARGFQEAAKQTLVRD